MHFLNWKRREKTDCWSKYQGSNCFLPQKWVCKGLRRNSFRNNFSPSFLQDSSTMSLVAEMGNFLPKLSCRSPRTLSWPVPIQRGTKGWGLEWLLNSLLFCSGPAEASGDALQRHKVRSGDDEGWTSPVFPFTVCRCKFSVNSGEFREGHSSFWSATEVSHTIYIVQERRGQAFQDKVCYGLQESYGILYKASK